MIFLWIALIVGLFFLAWLIPKVARIRLRRMIAEAYFVDMFESSRPGHPDGNTFGTVGDSTSTAEARSAFHRVASAPRPTFAGGTGVGPASFGPCRQSVACTCGTLPHHPVCVEHRHG